MTKESRCLPMECDALTGDLHARINQIHQRQSALVARMDELERLTRERLEHFSATLPRQLDDLILQQQQLWHMATEQEEESNRIFANQNELLNTLNHTLTDIHDRLRQLAARQDSLMPPSPETKPSD